MNQRRSTAVVTGASRGIGRAIALRLAATHHVVATARTRSELDSLAREIRSAGGSCDAQELDVADAPNVGRVLGGIRADVLVNNAGVGFMKPLLELSPEEWHDHGRRELQRVVSCHACVAARHGTSAVAGTL